MDFISEMRDYAWMFSLTSVLLVFIGWRVTYSNQMRLATRSESKSIVDALAKVINEISDVSIGYWLKSSSSLDSGDPSSKPRSVILATEYIMIVMAKSTQATRYINLLSQRGMLAYTPDISILIEKATLDCETAFMNLPEVRTQRTNDLMLACMEMMEGIYDQFQASYPPTSNKSAFSKINDKFAEIDEWHSNLN
ncbi:hypothetical protein [Erwinia aphidicola]|uniref:DUF4760 domain-containing protein n=1 Tax=Erwinia aphidicola TaxID=68334 RepID=A0ABU8DJY7_ERWAP